MLNKCCVDKFKRNNASKIKEEGHVSVWLRKDQWLRSIPGNLKKLKFICVKQFKNEFIKEYALEAYPMIFGTISPHLHKQKFHKKKINLKKQSSL